ncbi:Predicted nucleoside-diphosphate-sugar epimerase [Rhodococcus sp. AW25M09]|uniref:NAD(P)-binding oxidoreductase n=1 Tax=Rhodococcus sp. AW25M09 TaxID=1268303 RepID=UPI0002ABD77E|nr:NAD(P)-binding oxidoreductase [Rhodococcus sp. AW25M09]CCQ18012.1 Predicted nucleoside-diphosphate-sugar epimerase [Rhodococcus sp. AW25M09]
MKTYIIGAAGGIGSRLSTILTARGDAVSGMIRNPDHRERVESTGATAVFGDLIDNDVATLATAFAGHDAVVFSAGAHGTGMDKTTLIDGKGLEKAADAARSAGVERFVLVSAFPESGRSQEPSEGFEHYMATKKSADVYLTHTDLDWLIVRPGVLLDEPGDGTVTAGLAIEHAEVRRDNVAAFIAAALAEPSLTRTIVELTDGTTPVADAVRQVIDGSGVRPTA